MTPTNLDQRLRDAEGADLHDWTGDTDRLTLMESLLILGCGVLCGVFLREIFGGLRVALTWLGVL